jgi:hypothetical protein
MQAIPEEAEILKGVMNLLHEIARCQNADANVVGISQGTVANSQCTPAEAKRPLHDG